MPLPTWRRSETWGIGIALITLLVIIVFCDRDWSAFQSAREQVHHTQAELNLVSDTLSAAKDLETGQRGFVLVGDPSYLEPFTAARSLIQAQLAELERMTAGEPAQQASVQRIGALLGRKVAELQETVDRRQRQGFAAALAVVESGEGKAIMDQLRAEVSGFQKDGRARLRALEKDEDRYRSRTEFIAAGGSALLFALLVIAAAMVRRRSDARERALAMADSSKREVESVRDLLQTTLQSIGDAVITTDADAKVTFLNSVARDLTGWSDDHAGQPLEKVFRIVNEYTRQTVESPIDKVRRSGAVAGLANHTLLLARDGREIPIDDSGAPIRDSAGKVIGFVLVFRDITERKSGEQALRDSENRFRTLANAAPALLWVSNPDGEVTFVNRQWLEFTGRGMEEELKSGWAQHVHPDDLERILEIRRKSVARRSSYSFECRLRRADGEIRWLICAEAPRLDPEGGFAGFVGAWFDITELKEAQQSLERSEQRFRTLVAGTTAMVWQTEPQGACVAPEPGWEEFTGQSFEEYRGFGGIAAMHPGDREAVEKTWMEAIQARRPFIIEFRLWHAATKQYRHVVSRGIPLLNTEGEILQWIGTITDVTERHALEEKLRQAAKLESLGVLAGGIAHDFNNLLVGILGNASLLQSQVADPMQRETVDQILAAGERASVLTQQMLAYSGRGHFVVEPRNLSSETAQIVPLVRSSIPKHAQLVLNLADGLPPVEVDRAQFQQLVMNLVINGAEAIDGSSGTVTVSTFMQRFSRDDVEAQFPGEGIHPGHYVALEVQDSGHGMDADTQARIFDPFFTTKFAGRGLGLAAVIGIVKGHKGAIQVTSAPGEGTTFRVFLPATGAPAQESAPLNDPATLDRRTGAVLVVDDEEVVRKIAQTVFVRHGLRVLLASNGHEAIEVLRAHRDEVSAILLDLTMPVMSGEEALPRLRAIHPNVRILASSGFSQTEAVRRFGNAIDGFVQKPYTVASLLSALETVLPRSARWPDSQTSAAN